MGVLIPLTGSGADQGEWVKRGLEMAAGEINKTRIQKVELIFENTEGDSKKAVSAYEGLRTRHKMPAVFTWGSGVGLALTPLVNKDKVIQMGVATAAPSYTTKGDFTFRNFPSANQEADYAVNAILNDLRAKEIAILKINNDYGMGSAKAFRDRYEKSGGKVLAEESFDAGATDVRTQLAKVNSKHPKFVFIATYPKEGGLLLKQARELGMTSQFVSSVAILGGREFFDIAKNNADGLIVVTSATPFDKNNTPAVQGFVKEYRNRYGEELGAQHLYAARSYDAMKIVDMVLAQCSSYDTDCIKEGLFKIKDYDGVAGKVSFDENGDISASFNLQIIKDGKFLPYNYK